MVNFGALGAGAIGGASVNIIINGVDRFSKTIDGATRKLGGFGRFAGKAFKGLAIGAGLASAAILGIGASAIKGAIDLEESRNKFDVVFQDVKDSSGEVVKRFKKDFGLANRTIITLLGNTGDLLTGFGFTGEAALDLSEQVNRLAVDLGSFANVPVKQASEAITKGLLGERESMKLLGIAVNENTQEFKDYVAQFQEVEGATLVQAKALATLTIAQNQSKNAIGDAIATQDSAANRLVRMKEAVIDLKDGLGTALLPAFTNILETLQDDFIPAIEPLIPLFAEALVGAIELFSDALNKIIPLVKDTIGFFKDLFDIVTSTFDKIANSKVGKVLGFTGGLIGEGAKFAGGLIKLGAETTGQLIQNAAQNARDEAAAKRATFVDVGGGGTTVNIGVVQGTDPDDLSNALQKKLNSVVTTG